MKKVLIYSTPTCHYCAEAKKYFAEHNIQFENVDLMANRERIAEMIEVSGQQGVPVIVIDGQVIVGFDKPKVATALGLAV